MPSTGNPSCEGERGVSGLEYLKESGVQGGEGVRDGRNQVMEELICQGDEFILSRGTLSH